MNDRIMADPPDLVRRPDGYAQGCVWCVALGLGLLVVVAVGIVAGAA